MNGEFGQRMSKRKARVQVGTRFGSQYERDQRVKRIQAGLKIGYKAVPVNSLQFYFMDTVNNCLLHELVVRDANLTSQKEINTAYEIFREQVKELLQ